MKRAYILVIEPTIYDSHEYRRTLALIGSIGCDADVSLEADICYQLSRVSDLTCTSTSIGYYSPGSVNILVSPTCSWPAILMLVMGRYMLVVYSPGKCIKIRQAKVFKMAVIQGGYQNFELFKTD